MTDANPSAWLDFYRFSSDQLRAYNRMQASIIRDRSPNRFITHNMMGFFFQFDAFALAKESLDFVSWDSYPLGFTDTSLGIRFQFNFFLLQMLTLNQSIFAGLGSLFSDDEKAHYFRTGHPDLVRIVLIIGQLSPRCLMFVCWQASFHHSLYRGMGQGKRFWIMEQQPGNILMVVLPHAQLHLLMICLQVLSIGVSTIPVPSLVWCDFGRWRRLRTAPRRFRILGLALISRISRFCHDSQVFSALQMETSDSRPRTNARWPQQTRQCSRYWIHRNTVSRSGH